MLGRRKTATLLSIILILSSLINPMMLYAENNQDEKIQGIEKNEGIGNDIKESDIKEELKEEEVKKDGLKKEERESNFWDSENVKYEDGVLTVLGGNYSEDRSEFVIDKNIKEVYEDIKKIIIEPMLIIDIESEGVLEEIDIEIQEGSLLRVAFDGVIKNCNITISEHADLGVSKDGVLDNCEIILNSGFLFVDGIVSNSTIVNNGYIVYRNREFLESNEISGEGDLEFRGSNIIEELENLVIRHQYEGDESYKILETNENFKGTIQLDILKEKNIVTIKDINGEVLNKKYEDIDIILNYGDLNLELYEEKGRLTLDLSNYGTIRLKGDSPLFEDIFECISNLGEIYFEKKDKNILKLGNETELDILENNIISSATGETYKNISNIIISNNIVTIQKGAYEKIVPLLDIMNKSYNGRTYLVKENEKFELLIYGNPDNEDYKHYESNSLVGHEIDEIKFIEDDLIKCIYRNEDGEILEYKYIYIEEGLEIKNSIKDLYISGDKITREIINEETVGDNIYNIYTLSNIEGKENLFISEINHTISFFKDDNFEQEELTIHAKKYKYENNFVTLQDNNEENNLLEFKDGKVFYNGEDYTEIFKNNEIDYIENKGELIVEGKIIYNIRNSGNLTINNSTKNIEKIINLEGGTLTGLGEEEIKILEDDIGVLNLFSRYPEYNGVMNTNLEKIVNKGQLFIVCNSDLDMSKFEIINEGKIYVLSEKLAEKLKEVDGEIEIITSLTKIDEENNIEELEVFYGGIVKTDEDIFYYIEDMLEISEGKDLVLTGKETTFKINNKGGLTLKTNETEELIFNKKRLKDEVEEVDGGAIENSGTINFSEGKYLFEGNRGENGGAIYNHYGGTINFNKNAEINFNDNMAMISLYVHGVKSKGYGGAIYNEGHINISDAVLNFENNNAYYGGGIYNTPFKIYESERFLPSNYEPSKIEIKNSKLNFTNNSAQLEKLEGLEKSKIRSLSRHGSGGGIQNDMYSEISFENSELDLNNNSAYFTGGGIKNLGKMTFKATDISAVENSVKPEGGYGYFGQSTNYPGSNFDYVGQPRGGAISNGYIEFPSENSGPVEVEAEMIIDLEEQSKLIFKGNNATEGGAINNEAIFKIKNGKNSKNNPDIIFEGNYINIKRSSVDTGGSTIHSSRYLDFNNVSVDFISNIGEVSSGTIYLAPRIQGGHMQKTGIYLNFDESNVKFKDNKVKSGGGAIYTNYGGVDSRINIRKSELLFSGNISKKDKGGAIKGSRFNINNSKLDFNENSAPRGGAIYLENSEIIDSELNFERNTASLGGAIEFGLYLDDRFNDEVIKIIGSSIKVNNNSSTGAGGGIGNTARVDVEKSEINITDNYAGTGGGGLYNNGRINLKNSKIKISDNSADKDGGGIYIVRSPMDRIMTNGINLKLENSSLDIENNSATNNDGYGYFDGEHGRGGGIYYDFFVKNKIPEKIKLDKNSTLNIVDNYAEQDGGGIHSRNFDILEYSSSNKGINFKNNYADNGYRLLNTDDYISYKDGENIELNPLLKDLEPSEYDKSRDRHKEDKDFFKKQINKVKTTFNNYDIGPIEDRYFVKYIDDEFNYEKTYSESVYPVEDNYTLITPSYKFGIKDDIVSEFNGWKRDNKGELLKANNKIKILSDNTNYLGIDLYAQWKKVIDEVDPKADYNIHFISTRGVKLKESELGNKKISEPLPELKKAVDNNKNIGDYYHLGNFKKEISMESIIDDNYIENAKVEGDSRENTYFLIYDIDGKNPVDPEKPDPVDPEKPDPVDPEKPEEPEGPKTPKLNKEDHFQYIQGYPDETIRPKDNITREEVAAVFFRLLDPDYRETIRSSSHNYPDFNKDRWSAKHIGTLSKGNILEGYEDGEFKPRKTITRAEVATIASRFDNLEELKTSKFSDVSGHWAEKYIDSATEKGWIKGYPDGSFKPDQPITRAEFVTLVNNVLERKVNKENILDGIKPYLDLEEDIWYYEAMVEAINSHDYGEERLKDRSEVWLRLTYPDIEM